MLPDLSLCAPVLPTHIGIDSTLMYSMHLSVDNIAGAYWEAYSSASGDVCWETEMKYLHFGKWHYIRCKKGGSL